MSETTDKIFKIIADYLSIDVEDLDIDQTFDEDLNINEVELAEIIAEIEESFSINIETEEAKNLEKLRDLVDLVEDLKI